MSKKDGGMAFPQTMDECRAAVMGIDRGMTLRDDIAKSALQGMLAHSTRYRLRKEGQHWHAAIAEEAYELADAMLEARKKQ